MDCLITGATGFVAPFAAQGLRDAFPGLRIWGTGPEPAPPGFPLEGYLPLDLKDQAAVQGLIDRVKPDLVVHLASQSSVSESWRTPVESFYNNTNIFLNLVEAIRRAGQRCRVLSVGSSEEYGRHAASDLPLTETLPPNPASPYAVARVAQAHLSTVYTEGFGLDILCTRSFNHFGPGQSDRFVISALVRQFVAMERSGDRRLTVGNTAVRRDFTDVRDVARAYALLFQKGERGGLYNVCSGRSHSIAELIQTLSSLTGLAPEIRQDPALLRPGEVMDIIGNPGRLHATTGWMPAIPLEQTLNDMIAWWRSQP
ncbi:MAG: GDP-mannose 4,6-dehydratase [Spirochaetes bacterium]|nr:GDP-mannose 4,6-dehydratase [Spirochaetota bacterium]